METPNILVALIGVLLLVLGRRLYWLFVAGAGFLIGFTLAGRFFSSNPQWLIVVIALLGGLLGAALAAYVQRLAIFLGGFLIGGYLAYWATAGLFHIEGPAAWVPVLIGALIGAGIVAVMFEPALVLLSSLMGASLVVQALPFGATLQGIAFFVLVIVGIIVQSSLKSRLGPASNSAARRA